MSSDLQQLASRTNGAKSNGPITEEGKQASSQNRLAHGFNSKRVVLPGESQEEFDELLASYLDEHQPKTPTERTLVENMAIARWRQQRAWTLETAGIASQIRRPRYHEGEDPDTQAYVAFHTMTEGGRTLDLLNRYEARFERQFCAALTALLNLQTKRRAEERSNHPEPEPPPPGPTHLKLFWVDEEGNETLQADSILPPAAASGSFRKRKNPRQNHRLQLISTRPRHAKPAPEPNRLTRVRAIY